MTLKLYLLTENVHQKLVPDPFLILVNDPKQSLHARNSFKNDILKEDYQKDFKKLILFFLSSPSLSADKIIKNKKDLELVTIRFSGFKISLKKSLY